MPGLISVRTNVFAVVNGLVIPGKNRITTDGITYYAELVAGGGFTTDFGATSAGLHLGSSDALTTVSDTDVNSEIEAGRKAVSSGYPTYSDADADNRGSGSGVYSWLYDYSREQMVASGIIEGAIVDNLTVATKALCHFVFGARFGLTPDDAIKIFVNHTVATLADGETTEVYDPDGAITHGAYDSAGSLVSSWVSRFPPFHKRNSWTDVT
jgi:hypothetical protein